MVATWRSTPPPLSVPLMTLPPAMEGILGGRGARGARGAGFGFGVTLGAFHIAGGTFGVSDLALSIAHFFFGLTHGLFHFALLLHFDAGFLHAICSPTSGPTRRLLRSISPRPS